MKFALALVAAFAVAEASQFKSGAVTGFEKFTYGKFITRMKAPNKKGTVSSFFTYWNGPDFYPGGWNELDIEIVPSVEQNPFSMNVIYGDGHTKRESHDYKQGFNPGDDWHIYEIKWTPDFIAYSIDNKEVRRITSDPSVKLTTKPQSVMMNFWTPSFESWGKGLDAKDMPWYVMYDYIETYTYNNETKTFDFNWRDNFNTFDTSRWHKSDNTTFDANTTTFRASQSYIKDGNLVLKMEPDHPEERHGVHAFEPTRVEPVRTEPTPEHTVQKGKKSKKPDEHFDVGAEQHYSHMQRETHHEQPYAQYPYGYPEYGAVDPYVAAHFPAPVHDLYTARDPYYDTYARHADPYAEMPRFEHDPMVTQWDQPYAHEHVPQNPHHDYYDPYHMQDPYHHPQPPKTKAEAEKHLGTQASYLYKEMHDKQQAQKPQQQQKQQPAKKAQPAKQAKPSPQQQRGKNDALENFQAHVDDEQTPYEHAHEHEQPHMRQLIHGYEHHPDAHFEQGYWELKDHVPHLYDEGHFAGEDHGEYHYVEPERDHHLGHYYSYRDDREHHPQHVDEHHNTHGIEHRPDDWLVDGETHYKHHDVYQYRPEHSYGGDFDLHHHHTETGDVHDMAHHPHDGDGYTHDVERHEGTGMMATIEHQFDELFHDLEHSTIHGVEHHDLHYTKLHSKDEQAHSVHPHDEDDFRADSHFYEHDGGHYPLESYHYPTGHYRSESGDLHDIEELHKPSMDKKEQPKKDSKDRQKKNDEYEFVDHGHNYDAEVHDFVRQMLSTSTLAQ